LPYIKKYSGKVVVIKYGGNAMINPQLKEQVMEDIVLLWLIGVKVVLIHGGGPEINETMAKLGKKAEFINGLRVTDKETVDIVQMVLAGKVNKTLVNLIQTKGGHAVGVSGIDGGILEARMKNEDLGYVGEITKVRTQPINDLLEKHYIPVISTVAGDRQGNIYNINGDTAAAYIAGALGAERMIMMTDIAGILMDKETGEAVLVDEKEVTSETVFTPETSEGTVEVAFTFDGSALKGRTIVAFESVSYEENEIAVHADIEDEKQTVYFPEIGTTAKDGEDGDQEATADKKVTIVDTVKYENLVKGVEYKVTGVLMDKSTGKEFLVDGKPVIAEAEFTAKKENGEVEVTFTFNGEGMEGKDVVVFERMFLVEGELEIQIAEHEDINDEGQTVKLVKEPPVSTPKTGDDSNGRIWVVLAALAGTAFIVQIIRFYKKHEKTEE